MHYKFGFLFAFASSLYALELGAFIPRAPEPAVSTYIYPTQNGNLTFALSAAKSGDVYMHLSAPATYQWVGVGTGSEMDGSIMLIIYQNADKISVTLSPRLSHGHVEPSFSKSIDCVLDNSTAYHSSIVQTGNTRYYSTNIHCKNITALGKGDGKLDLTNAKQPFIYAWGPTNSAISSASETASIKRHDSYGNFWMDLTKATSSESDGIVIPTGASLLTATNSGADGQAQGDGDKVSPAHAAIMLVTFVLIFPLGVILLRFLESVKVHYIVQTIGVLAAVIGVAVGIYLSRMYNHSKNVSSGHQVFGLVLLVFLFLQWAIGLYHHLRFRKYQKSTVYGKVHRLVGPVILLGGIINGFTGFNFSGEPHNNVYYGAAVAVVTVVVLSLLGWKAWSKNKQIKGGRISGNEETTHDSYRMDQVQRVS